MAIPRAASLIPILLALLPVSHATGRGVTIEKGDRAVMELLDEDLPLYMVTADTYEAKVYPDGRVRITARKNEIIKNLVLSLGRSDKRLGDIQLEKGDRITLREGEPRERPKGDDPGLGKRGLLGITLHFQPDRVSIIPQGLQEGPGKTNPSPAFNLYGVFGDDAVAVRNVRNSVEDALPTRRICSPHIFSSYGHLGHYWPDVDVTCRNGVVMELRGITGVSHYAIGRGDPHVNVSLKSKRGFWALSDVKKGAPLTLVIRPADKAKATEPAPYYTVRAGKTRGMFCENERVLYHLDFAPDYLVPGRYHLQWTLEDHRQVPAGSGETDFTIKAGAPESLAVDLTPEAMGYFRAGLVLARADGKKVARRTHEFSFARLRLEVPALRDRSGVDEGLLWANILGMRGFRCTPSLTEIWVRHRDPNGEINWDNYRKDLESYLKIARQGTVKNIVFLMSGSPNEKALEEFFQKKYPDAAERKAKIDEVRRRWPRDWARQAAQCGIHAWEPINEPDLSMPQERYIEDFLKGQYPAVKAGDPKANFLGGSLCGLSKHNWLRNLYELGGGEFFDGVSFHPYTGMGFREAYRAEIEQWWQVMRDFKADLRQGLWMTESSRHRGWGFNTYVYDRFNARRESQSSDLAHMILNAEGMGIPRDRVYVFYLVEHGYNDFYLMRRTEPTSAAISLQVMNECLRDAAFVRERPLPGNGHHFQLYRDKTRTVAVAFTGDEPDVLEVLTDATEVVLTDLMGNRRKVRPKDGRFRVTISGDPTYMQVGPDHAIAPGYDGLLVQPNLAVTTLGATAAASSVEKPKPANGGAKALPPLGPKAAISGDATCYTSAQAYNGRNRGWDEDDGGKDKWPDWFEVKLPRPAAVSRVRVYHDYGAWERTLRDYDVQAFVGGQWKTVDQVRGNYYRDVYDHRFAPVTTDRVRVLIHMVNSCLFESLEWIPKLSTLRAVEVYAQPTGKAKAFFVREVLRKRVVAPGGRVTLRFRVRNITKAKLTGTVRLCLPDLVTAQPAAQKVTLEPDAETECTFMVAVDPKAAVGLYTVLAGLYEGDKMICADYATRVLCCKNAPKGAPKP